MGYLAFCLLYSVFSEFAHSGRGRAINRLVREGFAYGKKRYCLGRPAGCGGGAGDLVPYGLNVVCNRVHSVSHNSLRAMQVLSRLCRLVTLLQSELLVAHCCGAGRRNGRSRCRAKRIRVELHIALCYSENLILDFFCTTSKDPDVYYI
jgi:hypothetical protein